MRTLEFREPYKLGATTIQKEYINIPSTAHYERSVSVFTKYGIVVISELKWPTNTTEIFTSYFKTVIDGKVYSAFCDEAKLSDRQLKWMATHFIKRAIQQSKGATP